MNIKREIFDLLTKSFEEQQQAYISIDEMFGTTGEIPTFIDNTMARLEEAIMLHLGWHIETNMIGDTDGGVDFWVKDDMNTSKDSISDWFSIFSFSADYNEKMNILYNMSNGDAAAFDLFNNIVAKENEEY